MISVPLSAFGFDAEGAIPGRDPAAVEGHPDRKEVAPYRFHPDTFRVLQFAWLRELARPDHRPRRGVWLAGPKGAGKSTLVEQFFARLNIPVASPTCTRDSKLSDFVKTKSLRATSSGAMEVVEIDGPIAAAMRGGYPLVLNELDLADPGEITGLNDVIDRGIYVVPWSGEVIKAARGFIVFATANTNGAGDATGEYPGTGTMNTALMSRFYKLTVGYPSPDEELEVIRANGLLFDDLVARKVVEIANAIRSAYTNGDGGLTTPISTREVLDIMECVEAFAGLAKKGISPLKLAFEIVYTNGLEPAAAKAVEEIIDRIVA